MAPAYCYLLYTDEGLLINWLLDRLHGICRLHFGADVTSKRLTEKLLKSQADVRRADLRFGLRER